MSMRLFKLMCLAAIGFGSAAAQAQVDATRFTNLRAVPDPATAGAPVVARIFHAPCGAGAQPEAVTGQQISVQGNTITLRLQMTAGFICLATPPPPMDEDFALGSFGAGDYTLVVQPISAIAGVTYAPLTTTFAVTGTASSIPALSNVQRVLLILTLVAAAGFALRARGT
jgi:hypothetical protein